MDAQEWRVLEQVLATYPLGELRAIVPLTGGRTARSWHVRTSSCDLVLRRAEPDLPARPSMKQRQRLLLHLAQYLPEVPRLLSNVRGDTLIEAEGQRYELLAFIEGDTLDEGAGAGEIGPEPLAAAGRLLARYHKAAALAPVPAPAQPKLGEEVAARWERLKTQLVGQAISLPAVNDRHAGTPAPPLPELRDAAPKLEEWMRALRVLWASCSPPATGCRSPIISRSPSIGQTEIRNPRSEIGSLPWLWAHGDFTPYNLVYRGGLPVGLLDFGAVQWAPAAYDVAAALLSFPDKSSAAPPHFLAGYEMERPLSAEERAALPMLALHRRVVAILWIAEECLAGRTELRFRLREYMEEA